jgi:hypothetical protein
MKLRSYVVELFLAACALLSVAGYCKLAPQVSGAAAKDVAAWFAGADLETCRTLITENRVDVPTLLEVTDEEIASSFAVRGKTGEEDLFCVKAVRRVVKLLRAHCACDSQAVDFWSALRGDNWRTWVGGSLLLFTPRIGFIYAFCFDTPLFDAVWNSSVIPSSILAWVMIAVCPDVYFAICVLPFLSMNYILVACAVQHFLVQFYEEATIAWLLWKRQEVFEPGTSTLQKLMTFVPWWQFLPVAALVTAWAGIPLLFQQLAVGLFVVQSVYVTMSLISGFHQ